MADPLVQYRATGETLSRSVFDRLLDFDPDLSADPRQTIGEQMAELREGLRRDLETLLNTRRPPTSPPKELGELSNALVSYGVDSFFVTGLVSEQHRREFAAALELRIKTFETRLEDVRVTALPHRHAAERSLRLRIVATYVAQRGMPAITFETSVDPSTQRISVEPPHG